MKSALYFQGPSMEDIAEEEEENGSSHNPSVPNSLRSIDPSSKNGQSPKINSTGNNTRFCRSAVVPPFDTERYAEFLLRLECLKNIEVERVPRPGEFLIRAMCMGQVYGHFPCGNVILQSSNHSTRSEITNSDNPRSVDIYLDHDISFSIKFVDLIDNPLVLHLCPANVDMDPDSYDNLPPLGYICLDLGRIMRYAPGRLSEYTEAWYIPEKSQFRMRNTIPQKGMLPGLQLTIDSITGGFPATRQLMQGNLMTVFCESFHNLPAIVNQNVSHADNYPDVTMFMSLPHSKTEPVLKFPGGKYKETFLPETSTKKISIDENTQTYPGSTEVPVQQQQRSVRHSMIDATHSLSVQMSQAPREPRHWASVKENFPDTPLEATTMQPDSVFEPVEAGADTDTEIFGDGREDFMEFSETGDPRLVWNSIHRKYIPMENYRGMLARLSQNAVWPIEICVAVKKKSTEKHKKKKEAVVAAATKTVLTQQSGVVDAPDSPQITKTSNSNESNDRMLMGELGQQSSTATSEYTVVYHGLAFVDLSCLVHPGMKSARFSCRLFPFSTDLLQRKTCTRESVVPELLLLTLTSKVSVENSKVFNTSTSKRQTQNPNQSNANGGGNFTSSKTVRPSIGSETQGPQPPLQHHGSIIRRSENIPNDSIKKLHVHGSTDETAENVGQQVIERNPFIVFRISLLRSVVPFYKTSEIPNVVDEYLPKRKLSRRKLVSAGTAQENYKRAILEAATEISHEFSEHYWKEVLQNGQTGADQSSSNNATNETLKKGFLFYLNASGRYLILREHLRTAISSIVQQKCITLRPHGFHNHRDFQSYLHDMYVFLVDEMNEILSGTTVQETDPLKSNLDRLLQQTSCSPDDDLSKISLHNRQIMDLGVHAEESLAQGDYETCHKLHLQRICRDKESSRCWTEFAIMWLARGDDRMAEIAVREALRKDPLHLYALLISGMISVRHGDARGLDCLGAALGLYPMAPEMLVVLAIANSVSGNGVAADYFFRKAAYIHRTITGQSTEDIDKLFADNNAKKPFNLKQFTQDLDAAVSRELPEPKAMPVQADDNSMSEFQTQVPRQKSKKNSKSRISKSDGLNVGFSDKRKRSSAPRHSANAGAATSTSAVTPVDNDSQLPKTPSKEKKGSNDMNNNMKKSAAVSVGGLAYHSVETLASESLFQQTSNSPIYSFNEIFSDILLDEMVLPPMTPSLQSPSDVTQFSEKLERHILTIDYLEKMGNPKMLSRLELLEAESKVKGKGPSAFNEYIPKDEGVAPDNQIKEEYDKIINSTNDIEDNVSAKGISGGAGSKSGTFRLSSDGMSQNSRSRKNSKRLSMEENLKNKNTSLNSEQSETVFVVPVVPESAMTMMASVKMPTSRPHAPKLTNRLGSELIWAAQLLINLRLFDYVDGALAKHLYFYGRRTVQFIYLRALSLYLRQREEEALSLIKEAIEYDNSNGIYYALEGHCHYVLGNNQEAIASYEKALKTPHLNENRHLLYLRYGSLVLDLSKSKIAKRVFLHGVSKYPTPYMWLALGSACFQRQEYDQAESAFAEANRLDSTNPIAWGHLALSSLMQNKRALAEQSYKWALRFGLKRGVLMNEIQRLQTEKGFGDPSFPRIPNCVPHDYYLRRMGRMKPFNLYKEALNQDAPRMGKDRYEDTVNEVMLKKKLLMMATMNEWEGEGEYEEGAEGTEVIPNHPTQSTGFKVQPQPSKTTKTVQSAPPDMVKVIKSPKAMN